MKEKKRDEVKKSNINCIYARIYSKTTPLVVKQPINHCPVDCSSSLVVEFVDIIETIKTTKDDQIMLSSLEEEEKKQIEENNIKMRNQIKELEYDEKDEDSEDEKDEDSEDEKDEKVFLQEVDEIRIEKENIKSESIVLTEQLKNKIPEENLQSSEPEVENISINSESDELKDKLENLGLETLKELSAVIFSFCDKKNAYIKTIYGLDVTNERWINNLLIVMKKYKLNFNDILTNLNIIKDSEEYEEIKKLSLNKIIELCRELNIKRFTDIKTNTYQFLLIISIVNVSKFIQKIDLLELMKKIVPHKKSAVKKSSVIECLRSKTQQCDDDYNSDAEDSVSEIQL